MTYNVFGGTLNPTLLLLPLVSDKLYYVTDCAVQKKSREESSGSGSGVEILVNEPYTDGPGGAGQYTQKIYHIGSHLPGTSLSLEELTALSF